MNLPFAKLNWLTFLCFLLLAACTNDEDPVVTPIGNTPELVLSKVIFAGQDTTVFEYDSKKRIVKAVFPANLSVNSRYYKEFVYDAQGRMVKSTSKLLNGNAFGYNTFEYSNNVLTKVSSYSRSQGTQDYTHDFDNFLEYNSAKQVIKQITRKPDKPSSEYRYTQYIYNTSGNVVKLLDYVNKESGPVNDYTVEYTYDNKINAYQRLNFFGLGPLTFSANNILTEKETYPLSGQVKNTNRTYTYNKFGLPTKEIRTSDTNTFEIQNSYSNL